MSKSAVITNLITGLDAETIAMVGTLRQFQVVVIEEGEPNILKYHDTLEEAETYTSGI